MCFFQNALTILNKTQIESRVVIINVSHYISLKDDTALLLLFQLYTIRTTDDEGERGESKIIIPLKWQERCGVMRSAAETFKDKKFKTLFPMETFRHNARC